MMISLKPDTPLVCQKVSEMKKIQNEVANTFSKTFGRTPLKQRIEDILGEAIELSRYTDMSNLKEELGDLLASAIMCAEECDWKAEDLIRATLEKINRRAKQYKSLGRKTKVAILGGAFDPVTKGHIAVAKYVLDVSNTFDEVWLMPCYSHMHGKEMASPFSRLEMINLATRNDGRICGSKYEIIHELRGETYQLVKMLQEEQFAKDQYDFSIIIGMDNANIFHKWVNYELLERMIRFVVVPRAGIAKDPQATWYFRSPHIYLGDNETQIIESSSTDVRNAIKNGNEEAIHKMLDEKVYEYIKQNQLYQ